MAAVLVAHRSQAALEREAVAKLIAALRRRGHQVEHTSAATLIMVERAAEAADDILLVEPERWWPVSGWSRDGWELLLRERLEFCVANEIEQFAVILDGPREGFGGPFGAVPRFVLPGAWDALLDRLARAPRAQAKLRTTGLLLEPQPFVPRPNLDRALDHAVAAAPKDAGHLVWIRGGMGAGKTVLLRTLLGRRARQSPLLHVARPGIAATLRPSAVLELLDLRRAPPRPVLLAIDGLEQMIDRTDALVPEPERRHFAEILAGPIAAGITVIATSRALAPGLLGEREPAIDLDAPRWAAEQRVLVDALLSTVEHARAGELAGTNPGAARALLDLLLDLGEGELGELELPPRFAALLERAFVRLLELSTHVRRSVLAGLALLRVAPGPLPKQLLAAALGSEPLALLERHAAEWLRHESGQLTLTHGFAARYLAAELDPRDVGPHFDLLAAFARLRQRGPLDEATQAYADQHERTHQQAARGLSSDELWLRTVPELQRSARAGTLETRLELAVASAQPQHLNLVEAMFAIVRQNSHAIAADPNALPSLLWTNLVARNFAASSLDDQLSWAELRPAIRLQNSSTYIDRCQRILAGHSEPVRGCGLSRDGALAVTLSNDGMLRIWDARAGRSRELRLGGWSETCALTPDGIHVVVGSSERVLLIDTRTGEQLAEHKHHKATVTAIAISQDGTRVLSGDRNGKVLLWNVKSSEPLELGEHRDRVTRCTISSDGELGVSGGDDKVVRVWSFSEVELRAELRGHSYAIGGLALTRDGKRLVSICIGESRVWDLGSGDQLECFDDLGLSCAGAVLVADDREVLMAEFGTRVTRWNLADGRVTTRHLAHPVDMHCVAASDDGEWYLVGGSDHLARLWRRADVPANEDVGFIMKIAALLPGEQPDTVWVEGGGKGTRLLALADQRELVKLAGYPSTTAMAWLEDRLYVASSNRRLTVYSSSSGVVQSFWEPGKDWLRAVAIDRERERLAYAGDDKQVFVSALDGTDQHGLAGHSDWIHAIAFTPEGRLLAVDGDGHIKLWDLDARRAVLECANEANTCLYTLALDPSGTQVAVAGSSGCIDIWSLVDKGQLVRSLEGHVKSVHGLALRSDGRVLVSVGSDCTLRLWSFADGRPLTRITMPHPLSEVAFVGERLVVGDVTGNLHVFEVDWETDWSAIE